MNILIVDDAELAGVHLKTMMSGIPGISAICHSPIEPGVIEHINALLPDVVILNVSSKNRSEIDLLKNIKKHHAAIKVMVLVSHADKCCADRCMRAGADYFFDKAFFDDSFKFIRAKALMRIRAALWQLLHASVRHDRLVVNETFVVLQ